MMKFICKSNQCLLVVNYILQESSMVDIWEGSKYTSDCNFASQKITKMREKDNQRQKLLCELV